MSSPDLPEADTLESVWDYPRPPRLEPLRRRARVYYSGRKIADSIRAMRVLETSHPPTIYIPQADIDMTCLLRVPHRSFCEFKGEARYWDIAVDGDVVDAAAWSYPKPTTDYEALTDHIAFYPGRVEACFLDDEQVAAQAGDFYGGWITNDITGPFKGPPGTRGW